MRYRLEGNRAIVTGGGSGIGRAAAIRLAEEGAAVGILDINYNGAQGVSERITDSGQPAVALRTDVTVEQQVARAVDEVMAQFGGLHKVIANACVTLFGHDSGATELDLDIWRAATQPEEIANIISFLTSDEASFVTGAAWFADGGLSRI